jgi:hypothetical protein
MGPRPSTGSPNRSACRAAQCVPHASSSIVSRHRARIDSIHSSAEGSRRTPRFVDRCRGVGAGGPATWNTTRVNRASPRALSATPGVFSVGSRDTFNSPLSAPICIRHFALRLTTRPKGAGVRGIRRRGVFLAMPPGSSLSGTGFGGLRDVAPFGGDKEGCSYRRRRRSTVPPGGRNTRPRSEPRKPNRTPGRAPLTGGPPPPRVRSFRLQRKK